MRRVTLGATGIETSALGFGASSLGSRIDAAAGTRALLAALDAGVTWIDLAPVYGAGKAEEIVGQALRSRRGQAQICTKVGLKLAGGVGGGLRATLMPIARKVMGKLGPLQGMVRRAAPKANAKLELTPEIIKVSLEDSLRRLGTDRIDVFALHGPSHEEIGRDDIRRALEDVIASGKTRAVSVAGDINAAEAALGVGSPYGVVQMPVAAPGDPDPATPLAQAQGVGIITHSIMGEKLTRLQARAAAEPEFRKAACEIAGTQDAEAAVAHLLMARAFARNPEGVVLVSMLSPRSLSRNVAAAGAPPLALSDRFAALGL
jgi:aryl-alcohol dehydrogenase-like predicted oxidoreductase